MVTTRKASLGFVAFLALNVLAACRDSPRHDLTAPLVAPLASVSSRGATTTTTNEFIVPFGFDTQGECGEIVRFSGTLHAVTHTTITSTGSIHSFVHFGPVRGVRAVGLTSGGQYVVPGMLHDNFNLNGTAWPLTETFVNNFEIIGAGPLPNFNLHLNFHITVNANGETTVLFENLHAECR
jgi:hypothetical protein